MNPFQNGLAPTLVRWAARFPAATEDFPWGELVAKVNQKVIAFIVGEPVGCGAVKYHPGAPSELKRMWVTESARGRGIGRRLLTELEARAVGSGASVARLNTNWALVEAISLYRSAGYIEVPAFNLEPFAGHWFEKRLR
jgi:GNAT superfamily N-acetyltransferase